jgi:hypothetical protein
MQPTTFSPELLAQSFAIATNQSAVPVRVEHLQALIEHSRLWTQTVMETSTPKPQLKSVRCEYPGCKDGWIGKIECPVCEGQPDLDYEAFAQASRTIQSLTESVRRLADEKQALQSKLRSWERIGAQRARLVPPILTEMPKPKPGVPEHSNRTGASAGGAA